MHDDATTEEEMKYLLGNMGIEILLAIDKGAKTIETIKLFSGLPLSCIKGRVPVLTGLDLVVEVNTEFILTEKGKKFKDTILC